MLMAAVLALGGCLSPDPPFMPEQDATPALIGTWKLKKDYPDDAPLADFKNWRLILEESGDCKFEYFLNTGKSQIVHVTRWDTIVVDFHGKPQRIIRFASLPGVACVLTNHDVVDVDGDPWLEFVGIGGSEVEYFWVKEGP